jgi:hypothetical protein
MINCNGAQVEACGYLRQCQEGMSPIECDCNPQGFDEINFTNKPTCPTFDNGSCTCPGGYIYGLSTTECISTGGIWGGDFVDPTECFYEINHVQGRFCDCYGNRRYKVMDGSTICFECDGTPVLGAIAWWGNYFCPCLHQLAESSCKHGQK